MTRDLTIYQAPEKLTLDQAITAGWMRNTIVQRATRRNTPIVPHCKGLETLYNPQDSTLTANPP